MVGVARLDHASLPTTPLYRQRQSSQEAKGVLRSAIVGSQDGAIGVDRHREIHIRHADQVSLGANPDRSPTFHRSHCVTERPTQIVDNPADARPEGLEPGCAAFGTRAE
jgi:hypothetical protein